MPRNAIRFCDNACTPMSFGYRGNLPLNIRGEFPNFLGKRFSLRLSAFGNLIGHVVGIRAEEKAIDLDAGRSIAFVKHAQSVGDRAVRINPRPNVRVLFDVLVSQPSIAAAKCSLPKPASAWMRLGVKIKPLAQRHIVRDGFSGIVLGRHDRYSPTVLLEPVRRFNVARLAIIA